MKKHLVLGLILGLGIGAAVAAGLSANLSWTAPTTNTDSTPITDALSYNIYQGAKGSIKAQVKSGVTALQQTITELSAGSTACFELSAVAGGQESAHSAEACKTFPASVPNAPTNVVVF